VFVTIAMGTTTPTNTIVTGGGGGEATATRTPVGATAAPMTPTRTKTRTKVGVPTALPQTGIGESVGFPMLIVVGGVSMVVIILARQIRLGRNRR